MEQKKNRLHPFGHGGDIRTAAACSGITETEILDFSANINPCGPPSGLLAHLAAALPEIAAYPDPACGKLVEAICKRYNPQGAVVPGNGAGELIYLLMRAAPAGPVLFPVPTFTLYEKAAQAADREILCHKLLQENGFMPNIPSLCEDIRRIRPALTFICNPNNPTGTLLEREQVLEVARVCAGVGGMLVVDEAFLEFCPDWEKRTLLRTKEENILVLCSLTKLYAIPGLRLGFVTGPQAVVSALLRLRDPWSVNTLAQRAGEYVLRDHYFARRSAGKVAALRVALAGELAKIPGLLVYPPSVNYIFLESTDIPSDILQQKMLREKILIRDCGNYSGLDSRFFRVAVRNTRENNYLVGALRSVVQESCGGNK
ncbi:MAG: threonine-phosphate decarboxylase CobD [Bacillota bacterium]|nr:threonine-phosphate decarboxylase CobD [Bacillota bacterium]